MKVDEQQQKEGIIIEYFLAHPTAYIGEIAREIKIPKSTVQRYLKKNADRMLRGENKTIGEQLEENKIAGRRAGGQTSFQNNEVIRGENGHFLGSIKTESTEDKEEKKKKDIIFIGTYYLEHPTLTLEELSSTFETAEVYTKSYIYDCLTSPRLAEYLGFQAADQIRTYLNQNRYSFLRKTEGLELTKFISQANLTDIEEEIIKLRLMGISLDETAEKLNLSRARVMIYEDRAIEKLKEQSRIGKEK